jgi:argininosuccinate synthase
MRNILISIDSLILVLEGNDMRDKVVLAYSGGLDTSVAIKWIQENYGVDVVTLTVDVGQQEDLQAIEAKAKAIGALNHYFIDAKKEFAELYVFKGVKANAFYQGKYPLSTALARPLIASKLVEIAEKESAIGVAHGCTGKGNDQIRFDLTIKALAPHLKIIAPIREWKLTRDSEIEYARSKGIPMPAERKKIYSTDQNLWGRSVECGPLEDPSVEPPDDAFEWTTAPEEAPDTPEYVSITFEDGVPTALNGEVLPAVVLIERLNTLAGKHGVGRIDHMEDRMVGIKSREVYECPAAVVIIEAHKDLEKAVLTRHELGVKARVDEEWAFLAYGGLWMDPLREALDAFIDKTQERVSGVVRMKLYKGGLRVVGRFSPLTLYDLNLATYEGVTTFDQTLAEGFIELWGLQTKAANIVKRRMLRKEPV